MDPRGRAPSASWKSVRRRAQTRRQPTTRVVPTARRRRRSGRRTATSAARTSQVRPRSRVPVAAEPARRRVEPGEVLGVAQQHRRPEQAVRPRLVEADAVRRGAGCPARGRSRRAPRRARRASRACTSPVASCGAVWRSSRTSHDRRASKTTSATASRSSSSAACVRASSSWWRTSALMPRAPHLQSYASAAPSRSTVTSYGWISAADAVEQDPSLAPDRGRARPAGARSCAGQLLDDRAADLAADLLAALGDRQRRLEDRLGARAARPRRRVAAGPNSVGNIVRQPSASVVSPFITARASTRWAGVASASSVGGARDQRIRLDPGVDDRARVPRGVLEPHGRSPSGDEDDLRERRQPVDGAMRVGRSGAISSIARSIAAAGHPAGASSPRGRRRLEARPPRVGQVVDVRPLVLDLLAELAERGVGVEGAVEASRIVSARHAPKRTPR